MPPSHQVSFDFERQRTINHSKYLNPPRIVQRKKNVGVTPSSFNNAAKSQHRQNQFKAVPTETQQQQAEGKSLTEMRAFIQKMKIKYGTADLMNDKSTDAANEDSFEQWSNVPLQHATSLPPLHYSTFQCCTCTCRCGEVEAEAAALRVILADLQHQQSTIRQGTMFFLFPNFPQWIRSFIQKCYYLYRFRRVCGVHRGNACVTAR